jgi:hypothetical protein
MSTLLGRFITFSGVAPFDNIQYIKISLDDRIKSVIEDIGKMSMHLKKKTHTPDFLSYELGTEIAMPITSATNGFS